jgi:hypothetical protein
MKVDLGYYVENPLKICFMFQAYPVYPLTFAYSKGHSIRDRTVPENIPAAGTRYSRPKVPGIVFLMKSFFS